MPNICAREKTPEGRPTAQTDAGPNGALAVAQEKTPEGRPTAQTGAGPNGALAVGHKSKMGIVMF